MFLHLDPKAIPLENDEIRRENDESRQHIHQTFVTFFEDSELLFEFLGGTIDERLRRVVQILAIQQIQET